MWKGGIEKVLLANKQLLVLMRLYIWWMIALIRLKIKKRRFLTPGMLFHIHVSHRFIHLNWSKLTAPWGEKTAGNREKD